MHILNQPRLVGIDTTLQLIDLIPIYYTIKPSIHIAYGSGQKGVAVLLPGFAIKW